MKVKQVQTRKKEGVAAGFRDVMRERESNSAAFNPIELLSQSIEEDYPQAKLKIGSAGDIYEQEADQVADRVMSMPEPVAQRQIEEEEQEEPIQARPLAEQITPIVQRQLEQEEEPVQEKTLLQRQAEEAEEEEEEPVQEKFLLQRQAEEEEEPLQAKPKTGETSAASPSLESQINRLKGGGRPLKESTRAFFEPRFGADFSGVRVHTDSKAAHFARSVNAKAFTRGRNIVFGAGQYQPGTSSGKRLMAHELTHVVQQDFNTSAQLKTNISPTAEQRISRWKISGNKATVNKRSDRLWNLAKKITGKGLDWPCIWPTKMQSPKAWDDPYWRYLWIGDEFDISNLTLKSGPSATFNFEVADDDLQTVKIFYGGINPINLYQEMANLSNYGKTPIQSLTLCGHTAGNDIWGDTSSFSTDGLKPNEPAPTGAGAHNKMGPHRCWFTRNATVRIVGCTSKTLARSFASIFLRRGASALGTNHWICWWHQTDPFDSRFASVEGPPCIWPPTAPRLRNAADVNGAAGLWVTIRGNL